MLLYFGLATLVNHFLAYLIVFYAWIVLFSIRIWQKEISLRKKKGYSKYCQHSYILLPKIFSTFLLNSTFYVILLFALYSVK